MNRKWPFKIFISIVLILNLIVFFNINNYFEILEYCFKKNIDLSSNLYMLICTIFAFISILIVLAIKLIVQSKSDEIKGVKFKQEDGTYGTANWMDENDIEKVLGKGDIPGIILGKRNGEIIKLPFESYFNKNITVFGSSGSMKTIGFVLTNMLELLKYRKSIIVTDSKGDIYNKTSQIFRKSGYVVKVFNLKETRHSDRWNPLGENEDVTDVQTSSNILISNTQKKNVKDDFWPRAEENLIKAFEFYFKEYRPDENTLTEMYKEIAGGDIVEIDKKFRAIEQDSPARMSYNIFASGSDTIKASVLTGLGTRLQAFQNKDLQELTNETDIDLTLPGKKPCIYYVISSDTDSSRDFLVSLFFTFLFIKLVKYADSKPNGKCDVDVFFLLDEFANIGEIPDFNKKISTVRSRGLNLIPIVQSAGQFENRYPNEAWQEITGNCDIKICMSAGDTKTAEYFCDLIGVATAETKAIRKDEGFDGSLDYGQKNISTVSRNLLNWDEILRLPKLQLIAVINNNKPLILDKMFYTEHSLAKELKESPINEYKPDWNNPKIQPTAVKIDKKEKQVQTVIEKVNKKMKKISIHVPMTFADF